jgi:hypothetical protein
MSNRYIAVAPYRKYTLICMACNLNVESRLIDLRKNGSLTLNILYGVADQQSGLTAQSCELTSQ